jgi:hypothetical protein
MPCLSLLQITNIIAYFLIVGAALTVSLVPLGVGSPLQISEIYLNFWTPADWSFIIWTFTFTLLALFLVYQTIPLNATNVYVARRVWYWFSIGSLFFVGWAFAFQYNLIPLAVSFLVLLDVCLGVIYIRVNEFQFVIHQKFNSLDYWFITVPFSWLFVWMCIQLVEDCFILGVWANWTGSNSIIAPIVVTSFLLLSAPAVSFVYSDIIPPLLLGLQFFALYSGQQLLHPEFAPTYFALGFVLVGFGFVYGVFLVIFFVCEVQRRRRIEQLNRSLPTELQSSPVYEVETAKEAAKDLP